MQLKAPVPDFYCSKNVLSSHANKFFWKKNRNTNVKQAHVKPASCHFAAFLPCHSCHKVWGYVGHFCIPSAFLNTSTISVQTNTEASVHKCHTRHYKCMHKHHMMIIREQ